MGKQKDIKLRGTIGNVIYYESRGGYYKRARPGRVKRTAASVKSGLNFGKASRICRQIRTLAAPMNACNGEKKLMFRLTGALNKLINLKTNGPGTTEPLTPGLSFLSDFQLNDQAIVSGIRRIPVQVKATGSSTAALTLTPFVPKSALQHPEDAEEVICRILVTASNIDQASTRCLGNAEIVIPRTEELFQPPVLSLAARNRVKSPLC
jgi:hypothetical protein